MLQAICIMTFPLSQTYNTTSTQHSGKYLFSSTDNCSLVQDNRYIPKSCVDVVLCVFVTESLREMNVKIYMIHKIVLCTEGRVETKYT
jgi:hypothetical protein